MASAARPLPDPDPYAGDRIVELEDERAPEARDALEILREVFPPHERQRLERIAMEVAERRLGMHRIPDYHMLLATDEAGRGMAIAAGVYLTDSNAGMVTYLGVRPEYRARQLGRKMRTRLVEAFRADARLAGCPDLNWVVGEVRLDNPWLQRLVRDRAAIPFDFTYYHPGVGPGWSSDRWILYRQPVGDDRQEVPAEEVRRLIYSIWRRTYRIDWPMEHEGFAAMLEELAGREMVGIHPEVGG